MPLVKLGVPPVVLGVPPVLLGAPPVLLGAPPVLLGAPPVMQGAVSLVGAVLPVMLGVPPVVLGAVLPVLLGAPPVVLGAVPPVVLGAVPPAVLGAVLSVEEDSVVEVVLGALEVASTDVAPILDGGSRCPHCFCRPCIIASPPVFLVGSASADARNAHKHFPLYRKFWRVLNELGMWRHEEYLERMYMASLEGLDTSYKYPTIY